ncbi:MAG: aspartate:alanine exchanger family transporter [Vicinamibacterales bacterium]
MVSVLADNPLLLLFVVAAIGYFVGRIRVAGVGLDVGAVLFAGLAIGAIDPALRLPEVVHLLGLVLFVYTVGLANGPGFVATLVRGRGLRLNAAVLGILTVCAGIVWLLRSALGLSPAMAAGLFAGSLTNTPALAAEVEFLRHAGQETAEPVVAYSLAYPFGVLGMIVALVIARRAFGRSDVAGEPASDLTMVVARVTNEAACKDRLADVAHEYQWHVSFGRFKRRGQVHVATPDVTLERGDLLTIIGRPDELHRIVAWLGEVAIEAIEREHSTLDMRRIFVSSHDVAGRTVGELSLPKRFGAVVTRIRRGDVDFVPDESTVVELGDRLRVLAQHASMPTVTRFLGDSYRALSEMDALTFSLGCALGLLVGLIAIPLPGGLELRLGLAGGPLIVALLLGYVGRTGPVLWTLPYSVNLSVRQLGLMLFLAGIGTRAGYDFARYIASGDGAGLLLGGMLITAVAGTLAVVIGAWGLGLPFGTLSGVVAGLQTQPALLGFALEQSQDESPNVGYATVYPVAMIAKVLLGQLLLAAMQ